MDGTGILGGDRCIAVRSVVLVFISPEVLDQQERCREAATELKARGPRPEAGWVGRIPTAGRGRRVGRSARWLEDGTVPADFSDIILHWVMIPAEDSSGRYHRGPHTPRLNESACQTERYVHIVPMVLLGSSVYGQREERPRPESCPAGHSAGRICRTI